MTSPAALRWRLLLDEPGRGSRNMALDHALATALPSGEAVLRLYAWERPTVSFGKNEPARGVYDEQLGAARGVGFVRRPTGGGSVYHDREVTYAVVAPVRAFGGLRASYRTVNEALVAGLSALGVDARVAEGARAPSPNGPCFRAPADGEVVAGGHKLVGSAQVRLGEVFLQHGSVLLDGDQSVLHEISSREGQPPPTATLAALGVRSGPAEVAAALAEGARLALGGTWTEGEYRPPELDEADRLEWGRYASHSWTWGR